MKCEQVGNGPVVVLIPGLGCDGRLWSPVTSTLRDRFTVVTPEVWRSGSLAEAAARVVSILDELGVDRVGVAGLSMGGYITFELLRRWPQKIRAAAVLDSTPFPDAPERAEKRRQTLRLLHDGGFEPVLAAFAESVLAPQNAGSGSAKDLLLTMARGVGADAYARCLNAILERGSYEEVLRLLRVPILFIVGEQDSLTPPEVARSAAAHVPGAKVAIIPDSGHMTPLEAPAAVAELLGGFFDRHLPASP